MPAGEELSSLAQHGATMAIHLGVNHLQKIIVPTALPHYGADCPDCGDSPGDVAGSGLVVGTLEDIAEKVAAKGFRVRR